MSSRIEIMSNKELIDEFESMDCMVNQLRCCGAKDVLWLQQLQTEIERRGGEIQIKKTVFFPEGGDEDG